MSNVVYDVSYFFLHDEGFYYDSCYYDFYYDSCYLLSHDFYEFWVYCYCIVYNVDAHSVMR